MRIELRYFTGTGNSLKIIDTCKTVFEQAGYMVSISEINLAEKEIIESDLLGFCFPVYAFGIPRISRKYLKTINRFKNRQKAFALITAGCPDESGFATAECEKILKRKNCDVVYTMVIQMPINWTTSPEPPYPPSKDEAMEIIKAGVGQAQNIAGEILNGVRKRHRFSYPARYSRWRFYKDYWLFKYMGLQNLWRTFRVYDNCNGCSICAKICPTGSIMMVDRIPTWTSTCEQCMRCVNFCPNESIYQTMGGDTKGKNRYYEPGFNPGIQLKREV